MAKVYFRHTKTNRRYEVVRLDSKHNKIILKGEHASFEQPYDKDEFKRLGYVLERDDDD